MNKFNKATAAILAGAIATILFALFPAFFQSVGLDNAAVTAALTAVLTTVAVLAGPKNSE